MATGSQNISNYMLFVDNSEYKSVCSCSPGVNTFFVVHKFICDLKRKGYRVEPGHSINHGLFIIL